MLCEVACSPHMCCPYITAEPLQMSCHVPDNPTLLAVAIMPWLFVMPLPIEIGAHPFWPLGQHLIGEMRREGHNSNGFITPRVRFLYEEVTPTTRKHEPVMSLACPCYRLALPLQRGVKRGRLTP